LFGNLQFLDREGNPGLGVNVGDTFEFRSYIEGATKARAIWTLSNIDRQILHPNGCFQLESQFEAFRTHKGDFGRTVFFQYTLVNPDTKLAVPLPLTKIEEFRSNVNYLTVGPTVEFADTSGKPIEAASAETPKVDFFKDLVSNDGKVEVHVACIDPGQYVGMSRVNLFFRKPDRTFAVGYLKTLVGIECLLLLVVFLGVAASTFVKGPVAVFLTGGMIMVGMCGQDFLDKLILPPHQGGYEGGGVFESVYRIVMHMNPSTELPAGPAFYIMQLVDWVLELFLWLVRYFIPNCEHFVRMPEYVANGFDVQWRESLLPSIMVTLGFFIPCVFVGFLSLQSRELESK
jgi:hypothetical protein